MSDTLADMDSKNSDSIFLTDLAKGFPAITPVFGATLAEACAVCLSDRRHPQGINLEVKGDFQTTFKLYWQSVTPQMIRCWNDLEYTTEQAAYGTAFMIITRLTDFTVIERSRKGTGFDYWLGTETDDELLPFQNKVRLEISGIRAGYQKRINFRLKQKLEQTKSSDGILPAYVVVVEFSKPIAMTAKK